eukprot:261605-Pelagomonas_calceolata.AAC.1
MQAGTHTQRGRQAGTHRHARALIHAGTHTYRRAHTQACTHTGNTHELSWAVLYKIRANGDSLCMREWAAKGTPTVQ